MPTNDTPKTNVVFTESPVSWNTRYITPEGFECQLTLRGEPGQEVLEKAGSAMAYLLKNGCHPTAGNKSSNHYQPPSQAHPDSTNSNSNGNGNNGHDRSWCPIHECEMKRWEKDGRVWFSHKAGDEWCSGKVKRN
jgi:hypothetical protein